jgi:prepilin-type N-terminal cleavage/methylation domain-containing protein
MIAGFQFRPHAVSNTPIRRLVLRSLGGGGHADTPTQTYFTAGFSLIEILASVLVLSIAALGVTAVWTLADQKALYARLDNRTTRILNEYAELQNFAPSYVADSQSSFDEAGGIPLKPDESRQGYLYHPRNSDGPNQPAFLNEFPYQISFDNTGGGILTFTYQRNPRDPNSKVITTLNLNVQ